MEHLINGFSLSMVMCWVHSEFKNTFGEIEAQVYLVLCVITFTVMYLVSKGSQKEKITNSWIATLLIIALTLTTGNYLYEWMSI